MLGYEGIEGIEVSMNVQTCELNVCSQDLNQFAAFRQELPRSVSGTGHLLCLPAVDVITLILFSEEYN